MNELRILDVLPELGKINALIKNLMKQMGTDDPNEAIRRFNAGEWVVSQRTCRWREENGVIRFTVTSDGTTGPQWIKSLKNQGLIYEWARDVLNSSDFVPTNGVRYEVAVLKGILFPDEDRVTKKIRAEASRRNLAKAHPEIACLAQRTFTDKDLEEMGLSWIVAMHDPIKDAGGDPRLLSVDRRDSGCSLDAGYDDPYGRWCRGRGFAFVVSQVSLGS
ncbi:MAG: hypothetical protein V1690_01290 [Candidatus Moraniibacteriota bacterium]